MAGQIIKRSEKVYLVRIFMGKDQRTGKRRYINKTIHGTKKDAQAYLTGALRDQDLGRFVEPTKVQLETFLEQWLEEVAKPKLREATYHGYADVVRLYVNGKIGMQRVSELTPYKLQTYYAKLRELGVGNASLKKLHVVIASSLQQAVHWGLITINPAKSVVVASQRSTLREDKVRVMTAEEAKHYTLTIDDGEITVAEEAAGSADATVSGPERAWIEALGPDASRTELEIAGDSSLAEGILDALAPAAVRSAAIV